MTTPSKTGKDLELTRELSKLDYYHGLLPREDMISLLRRQGDFLIRFSETKKGEDKSFILSTMVKEYLESDGIKHFIITRTPAGKFVIDMYGFPTIGEMIDFHLKGNPVTKKDPIMLLTPIKRQTWEHAHEDIILGKKLGEGAFGEVSLGTLKIRKTASTQEKPPEKPKQKQKGSSRAKSAAKSAGENVDTVPVAIKLAKMETVTKEQIKEIMAEARLMRRFNHPNVVKFYGIAVLQEPLMVLMEVCQEGALSSYLKKVKQPVEKLNEMIVQAAWGLEYIHRNNVLHRDIAARNCLYGSNNVKIADFGLSREGKCFKMDPQCRVPIRWLAPEIMETSMFTQKTDVWAYGIMCWEIYMEGAEPYTGQTVAEVAVAVRGGYRMEMPAHINFEVCRYIRETIWNGAADARPGMTEIVNKWKTLFPNFTPPPAARW